MTPSNSIRAGAILLLALLLSGCGGYVSQLPLVGAENAPPPPEVRPDYPTVGLKSGPDNKPITAAERAKLEAELAAARLGSVPQRRLSIAAPAPATP